MRTPTRKDTILDLVLTNLHNHNNKLLTFPPFALSDHNNISVWPQMRKVGTAPDKFNFKRDLQPSQKAETGRYLCSFDWPLWLSSFKTCSELLCVFEQVIYTRLDLLMPVRKVPMNTHAPWMMKHLKDLIQKRQQAFHNNGADSIPYKFYRNQVNWERKLSGAKFYKSQVAQKKKEDPKAWNIFTILKPTTFCIGSHKTWIASHLKHPW